MTTENGKQNKVAIVSGAAGGIGHAICKRLEADGFTVIPFTRATCDMTDSEAIKNAVQSVINEQGRIDVCVHAAVSPILRKRILDTSIEEFKQQFEVGLFGGYVFMTEAAKQMKEQKEGTVIEISSATVDSGEGAGSMAGYISAKFAGRGFVRELARELAIYNVSVHEVSPGFVETKLNGDIPARAIEFLKERTPGGKLTTPEDVANEVADLCAKE